MEHVSGGQLFDYLENCGPMTKKESQAMFCQLLSAVRYCHQKHTEHWDLKPDNILLDSGLHVKLSDFGFSRKCSDEKLSTFCGTISYIAPEILQLQPCEGLKVDVWSMGVVLYGTAICGEEF